MLSAVAHLANPPTGVVVLVLVIAALSFFAAAVASFLVRSWWSLMVSVGLALFVLSFLIT